MIPFAHTVAISRHKQQLFRHGNPQGDSIIRASCMHVRTIRYIIRYTQQDLSYALLQISTHSSSYCPCKLDRPRIVKSVIVQQTNLVPGGTPCFERSHVSDTHTATWSSTKVATRRPCTSKCRGSHSSNSTVVQPHLHLHLSVPCILQDNRRIGLEASQAPSPHHHNPPAIIRPPPNPNPQPRTKPARLDSSILPAIVLQQIPSKHLG